MADDWMTDDHKAAALEALMANAPAVDYAQQRTEPDADGRVRAGYHSSGDLRVWFGAAHGCTAQWATKAPEHGGPAEVFVRGILTTTADGVELVDGDGNRLNFAVQAVGRPVTVPEETTLDLVSWLREQIADLRRTALAALRGYPFEDPDGSDRDGDFWHSHWDALYQGPRPDHPVGGKELADFPQAPHAAAFAARFDPQAALAQCEAHEKLLDLHPQSSDLGWLCELCGGEGQNIDCTYPCDTIRTVALAYRHCPGFREEWGRG